MRLSIIESRSERRVESRSVSTNEWGGRFNIIESRVKCRIVSTNEGGWDLEISLREELNVEVCEQMRGGVI